MISLRRAQKLKKVGLIWHGRAALEGDLYYFRPHYGMVLTGMVYGHPTHGPEVYWVQHEADIWFAPSLTQLLMEIKFRGVRWQLGMSEEFRYYCALSTDEKDWFWASTLEDAAGDALIHLLERGKQL